MFNIFKKKKNLIRYDKHRLTLAQTVTVHNFKPLEQKFKLGQRVKIKKCIQKEYKDHIFIIFRATIMHDLKSNKDIVAYNLYDSTSEDLVLNVIREDRLKECEINSYEK